MKIIEKLIIYIWSFIHFEKILFVISFFLKNCKSANQKEQVQYYIYDKVGKFLYSFILLSNVAYKHGRS